MSRLYAILFTNGVIKVGRASGDAAIRIDQHRQRLIVAGVDVAKHCAHECYDGKIVAAERALIERCAAAATARRGNEWFDGLHFDAVCEWLKSCCEAEYRPRRVIGNSLDEYLNSPGAMSVAELRKAIGAANDMQIRQWRYGYSNRVPSPANCVAIEFATGGSVMRWNLRPDDWHKNWPELITWEGAPAIPATTEP